MGNFKWKPSKSQRRVFATNAELLEGQMSTGQIMDYVKD